jgi:hypothetical protein
LSIFALSSSLLGHNHKSESKKITFFLSSGIPLSFGKAYSCNEGSDKTEAKIIIEGSSEMEEDTKSDFV